MKVSGKNKRDTILAILMVIAMAVLLLLVFARPMEVSGGEEPEPLVRIDIEEDKQVVIDTVEVPMVSKPMKEPPPKVEEPKYISLGVARITAYCSCEKCCGKWASMRPVDEAGNPIVYGDSGEVLIPDYSVAVDPDVIPYGTKIYIDGKEYIAHDCGSAITGMSIDIYLDSHEKACEVGMQYIEIFILVEE